MKIRYLLLLLLTTNCFAESNNKDYENYCRYVMDKARAEATRLNAPDVFARVEYNKQFSAKDQTVSINPKEVFSNKFVTEFEKNFPEFGGIPAAATTAKIDKNLTDDKYLSVGISKNLQDYAKKDLVLSIANSNCEFYKANLDATEQLKYAMPNIEKQNLTYRLNLFKQAKADLQDILKKVKAQVETQNETIMALYNIESLVQKVETGEQLTQMQIASIQSPYMEAMPLNNIIQILDQASLADRKRQHSQSELDKKNNWGVTVNGGITQGILGSPQGTGAYVGINANYNLGAKKYSQLLDSSDIAYNEWKLNQRSGLNQQVKDLKQKIKDLVEVEKQNLVSLRDYDKKMDNLNTKVSSVSTSEGEKFKAQLKANRIIQNIEIKSSEYKISILENYVQ